VFEAVQAPHSTATTLKEDAQTAIASVVHARFFEPASSVALAFVYGVFLVRHVQALEEGMHPVTLLAVILEGLLVSFFIVRHNARARTLNTTQLLYALAGTFLLLGLRPGGIAISMYLGPSFMAGGSLVAIAAYLSLNRSFGISPSLRKVKTTGLYRFVRHPIYSSYFVMCCGYLLMHASVLNAAFAAAWTYAQLRRMRYEEQLLARSEEYRAYQEKVRWRLVPGIV